MKKLLLVSGMLFLNACADERPNTEDAKAHFSRLYPDAKILDIHLTEDETAARSYRYNYLKGDQRTGSIEIQYMKIDPKGIWGPSPEPPSSLP